LGHLFLKDGLPGNWLSTNKEFYPNGVKKTLEKIKDYGFKPGFWVAPFYMNEKADDFQDNYDNLWKNNKGTPSPGEGWLWAANADDNNLPVLYYMDTTHPKTIEYLKKIFTEYREWGIRYYMLDFLLAGRPRKDDCAYDNTMVRNWEGYRKCLQAVREAAGSDTHLLSAGRFLSGTCGYFECLPHWHGLRGGAVFDAAFSIVSGQLYY